MLPFREHTRHCQSRAPLTLAAQDALLAHPQSLPDLSLTVRVLGGHAGAPARAVSQRSYAAVLKAQDLQKRVDHFKHNNSSL
jgi:hypothetical protein